MKEKTRVRSFDRLELYAARARQSAECGDRANALANLAEAAFIARWLWQEIAKETDGNTA
jgi:hypothetical protein